MELSPDFTVASFPDMQTAACFAVLAYSEEEPRKRYLAGESNEVSGLWLTPISQLSDAGRALIFSAFSETVEWEATPDAVMLGADEARSMSDRVLTAVEETRTDLGVIRRQLDMQDVNVDSLKSDLLLSYEKTSTASDKQMAERFDKVHEAISSSVSQLDGHLTEISSALESDIITFSNRVIESTENLLQTEVAEHNDLISRLEDNVKKLAVDLSQNLQALTVLDQRVYASLNNWLAEAVKVSTTEAPLIVAMARFVDAGGIDSMIAFSDAIREANRLTDDLRSQIKILSELTSLNDTAVNSQMSLQSDIKSLIERDQITKKVSNIVNSAGLVLKGADLALKLNSQKGGL